MENKVQIKNTSNKNKVFEIINNSNDFELYTYKDFGDKIQLSPYQVKKALLALKKDKKIIWKKGIRNKHLIKSKNV